MKYKVTLITMSFLTVHLFAQNGLSETFYENGNQKSSCNYKNGKKNGQEKEWNSDGSLKYSCEYKNGMKHGLETGKKFYSEVSAKDLQGNRVRGWYRLYKKYETYYVNGKKDGLHQEWYLFPDNVIINDKWSNRQDAYVSRYNGNLAVKSYYKNGEKSGLEEIYLRDGRLYRKHNYLNGKLHGLTTHYYNGSKSKPDAYYLSTTIEYDNGKKHGKYTTFWDCGSIRYIWKYIAGERVGDTQYVNKRSPCR